MRQLRAITPDNSMGKFGLLDYALAYRRADEARAALAEIETRWPKDAAFAETLLPWALGEPGIDHANYARRSPMHRRAKRAGSSSPVRTSTAYNADIEISARSSAGLLLPRSLWQQAGGQAMLRDPRVKAMSCATVSRRIGARKAGPPDPVGSGRVPPISSAASMLRRSVEMPFFAELKRRNVA